MFGRNKDNGEEKPNILTWLKNFFTGKKESEPEIFEMNDLEPADGTAPEQPDIATYSRFTEEYQQFLASQEQQIPERGTSAADETEVVETPVDTSVIPESETEEPAEVAAEVPESEKRDE